MCIRDRDKYGRIDIVITAPELLIAIEVKIDADERSEQIADYQKWMKAKKYAKKYLVFLTPDGHEPKTPDPESIIIPFSLSYAEIAEIFSSLIHTIIPCPVRAVIEQYITACRLIAFGEIAMTKPDKDLIALLTKPGNLKPALEIEQQMAQVRKDITINFRDQIVKFLEIKLKGIKGIDWRVKAGLWGDQNILIWTSRDNNKRNTTTYYFKVEEVFYEGSTEHGRYLWCCPNANDSKIMKEIEPLTAKMKNNNWNIINNDKSIFAYQFLRGGKYAFNSLNNTEIVQCHDDNQNVDHPCAAEIAEEIWKLFDNYRADIEALPSFLPT